MAYDYREEDWNFWFGFHVGLCLDAEKFWGREGAAISLLMVMIIVLVCFVLFCWALEN